MNEFDVIALGLGIKSPWRIAGLLLDREIEPHQLKIRIKAARGAGFPYKMTKNHIWNHVE
ncbi:MAG: hypothetical protein GWP10_13960 [Nitrospiraceae bacterium]|nr:hypothetical protein [Nitrospiraceae bacterium]